ncbi:MAG TPA: hypothetical protein VGC76_05820 [Pyrinomonadaceae bacterium]|jgi:hypothetical protein
MEIQSGAVSPIGSIQKGWEIIKSDYWIFFLMTLVAGVILFVLAMVLGLIGNLISATIAGVLGMATSGASDAVRVSASIAPQLLSMFISLFVNIIVGTIAGALFCGLYSAFARKATTGIADFGDLFSGFSKIQACLIVVTVVSIIQFIVNVVLLFIGGALGVSAIGMGIVTADGKLNTAVLSGLLGMAAVLALAYIIVSLIISALTSFAYPLIAERDLPGGQALSLSAKGGLANIVGMILLLILLGLMSFFSLILCVFPFFFVLPIVFASIFAAYRSVFGAAQDSFQHMPPPPPNFGNQPGY